MTVLELFRSSIAAAEVRALAGELLAIASPLDQKTSRSGAASARASTR